MKPSKHNWGGLSSTEIGLETTTPFRETEASWGVAHPNGGADVGNGPETERPRSNGKAGGIAARDRRTRGRVRRRQRVRGGELRAPQGGAPLLGRRSGRAWWRGAPVPCARRASDGVGEILLVDRARVRHAHASRRC